MSLLRAQELLLRAENLLDESESEISKLKSLLKQAQGFLPYDKTFLYKEINEALLHQNIDESLPIVKEEINSYIKSFKKNDIKKPSCKRCASVREPLINGLCDYCKSAWSSK